MVFGYHIHHVRHGSVLRYIQCSSGVQITNRCVLGYLHHVSELANSKPIKFTSIPRTRDILRTKGMELLDGKTEGLAKNLPEFAYHGTSRKKAKVILTKGVKGISLTGNPHDALYWAMQRMNAYRSDAVVLRIRTDLLDSKLVTPNDSFNPLHIFYRGTLPAKSFTEYGFYSFTPNELDEEVNTIQRIADTLTKAGFKVDLKGSTKTELKIHDVKPSRIKPFLKDFALEAVKRPGKPTGYKSKVKNRKSISIVPIHGWTVIYSTSPKAEIYDL